MSSTFYHSNGANKLPTIRIESPVETIPVTLGENTGLFKDFNNFMDFISSVHNHGLFQTVYGKSFPQVAGDFFKDLFREIGIFVLCNGDLLFLIPAIAFMFLTFIVGKNRFTKWILPLWFAYFISRVLLAIIL